MKEYILVDAESVGVYAFRINESGHRQLEENKKLNDVLQIKSVEITISLSDIYEETKLTGSA